MNRHYHKHRGGNVGPRRLSRIVLFALVFVAFFAISNYYLGLYSFASGETAPPKKAGGDPTMNNLETNPIKNLDDRRPQSAGGQGDQKQQQQQQDSAEKAVPEKNDKKPISGVVVGGDLRPPKPGGEDGGEDNKPPVVVISDVRIDKWPETDEQTNEDTPTASCKHTRLRDYSTDPIVIGGRFSGNAECDVPCVGGGSSLPDASVGFRHGTCSHTKSIFFTMENTGAAPGSYDIIANTRLSSDVPLPYFSWAEYAFQTAPQPKTASAHVAAFISNCGPQRRLNWMKVMMEHGVKIDSFGACMRNKDLPGEVASRFGGNYNAAKMAVVSRYKFVMAFENSGTEDYVTEKLFGVFVAGSVPLYDGAPNGKKFGPSAKSMLFANDFGTPEKMAEYILYLASNDTAYEEYLSWKRAGPSDEWVALIDLANVHSNCRLCIRTADLHRKEIGPVKAGNPPGEQRPPGKALELHVRERGKFWMYTIYLTPGTATLQDLKQKIEAIVPHDPSSYLFSVYELWSRTPVLTNDDVLNLALKTELEAIFVVPRRWDNALPG